MNYKKIIKSGKRNIDFYKQEQMLNSINIVTHKKYNELSEMLKGNFFKVPFFIVDTSWGYEKVYVPFTDKLFKIINTNINNTSIQLHPLKHEIWYPLMDVSIFDGECVKKISYDYTVDIPPRVIHSLKKGSVVFEVQDNIPYEYDETYRIYDFCDREIHPSKFKAFSLNSCDKLDIVEDNRIIKKQILKEDVFIFSKFSDFDIESDFERYRLEKEELWFLKEGVKILKDMKDSVMVKAKYFEIGDEKDDWNVYN